MPRRATLALIAALSTAGVPFLGGCTPAKAPQAATSATALADAPRHAVSGLPVIPLTVTSAKRKHSFKVEVAATYSEQEKGLMFRTEMGADEGMIFPTNPPRTASFWMKNTVIPLDLVFIGPDRRILNIAAMAQPYSLKPIFSDGPAAAVLELNGGRAKELGIAPGDKVDW